jgi:hypothetical protein
MVYQDSNGFDVAIGTIVGIEENFLNYVNPDIARKSFIVVSFINLGDMVEIAECDVDQDGEATNVSNQTFEIEPYKIGAI